MHISPAGRFINSPPPLNRFGGLGGFINWFVGRFVKRPFFGTWWWGDCSLSKVEKTMTARDVTGFSASCSAPDVGLFSPSPHLGRFPCWLTCKTSRKRKKIQWRKFKKKTSGDRNYRFLSLFMVVTVHQCNLHTEDLTMEDYSEQTAP